MKFLEDAAYVVLLAVLMPVLMALFVLALIALATRRIYWSMRGMSTTTRDLARTAAEMPGSGQ